MQYARLADQQCGSMLPSLNPFTRGLDSDEFYGFIFQKRIKNTHRIAAAAHAGDNIVRQ